jgi:hypothetical protein
MAKEKEIGPAGFFEQLTHLFLSDDSRRWIGITILILLGGFAGSLDLIFDKTLPVATVGMSINLLILAILLFGLYSVLGPLGYVHKVLRRPAGPAAESDYYAERRRTLVIGGAICSFAVAFGYFSYTYQKITLNNEFRSAIEIHDYVRVASITEQASTVSENLHSSLLQKFNQAFVTNTVESPDKPGSVNLVLEAIRSARQYNQRLDVPTVVAAGKQFAKASASDPEAWAATTALLDYKSFLEMTNSPASGQKGGRSGVAQYQIPGSAGPMYTIGASSWPDVPAMHLIGQPDLNQGSTTGPKYLNIRGGTFPLDGYVLRRVIIQDAHVTYYGGPLDLDQVYFVNCTFDVKQDKNGLDFADAVFSGSATKFAAS